MCVSSNSPKIKKKITENNKKLLYKTKNKKRLY